MAIGEMVQVVFDHPAWGFVLVLALFLARSLVRSRPGRELGRVIAVEIRWRYLSWKGWSEAELRRLLRHEWDDHDSTDDDEPRSEPPTTV